MNSMLFSEFDWDGTRYSVHAVDGRAKDGRALGYLTGAGTPDDAAETVRERLDAGRLELPDDVATLGIFRFSDDLSADEVDEDDPVAVIEVASATP